MVTKLIELRHTYCRKTNWNIENKCA